jgi:hypothetical protein
MRAQITLFGVTIAFVPADQDCRAERRILHRSLSLAFVTERDEPPMTSELVKQLPAAAGTGLRSR